MSGFCLECGNDLCICSELEEEAKKQPDVVFICQRKEIEKLQEQNKILREALEFVVKQSGSSTNYNKVAREALIKTGTLSDKEIFDLAGKIYGLIKTPDLPLEGVPFGDPIKDEE